MGFEWSPPRKFCNSRWLKKRFCCTLRPFLLVNLSLFYRHHSYFSNAYHSLFRLLPLPQPPKYQRLFRPLRGSHQAVASKLTDSSKFKVTVKSDTDIPAMFLCFLLFIFNLSYFYLFSFLSFIFVFFCVFILFLFINLRTCNSIYKLTRAYEAFSGL